MHFTCIFYIVVLVLLPLLPLFMCILSFLSAFFPQWITLCTSVWFFSDFFPFKSFRWWSSPNPLSYCPLNVVQTLKTGMYGVSVLKSNLLLNNIWLDEKQLCLHFPHIFIPVTFAINSHTVPPPLFGFSAMAPVPSAQRLVWICKASIKDKNKGCIKMEYSVVLWE